MKRRIFLYAFAAIGILLNGCANKQITSEKNINNKNNNETRGVLKACSEKENFIEVDKNLTFMGKEYKDNERYISEIRICRVNDSLVSIKLAEEVKIDGNMFKNTSEETVLLFKCGQEKSMFSLNKKFSICKRTDGFTQVRFYSNLN